MRKWMTMFFVALLATNGLCFAQDVSTGGEPADATQADVGGDAVASATAAIAADDPQFAAMVEWSAC